MSIKSKKKGGRARSATKEFIKSAISSLRHDQKINAGALKVRLIKLSCGL